MLRAQEQMKVWTKEEIEANIMVNDKWLLRAIEAIYERQTYDEQTTETTKHSNGIGFNGVDAPILSSFATQIKTRNFLSPKQITLARRKMKKYCGQLAKIANKEI